MRRSAVLAGACVLLAPALFAVASPAVASAGSLTVTTLGRDGRSVPTQPQAFNIATGDQYYLTSGRAARLPQGTYDVLVDIFNARDETDTLAAKRVRVTGATRLGFDARQGAAIRAALRPAAPRNYSEHFLMALCEAGRADGPVGWTDVPVLYVIPSTLASVRLAYSAIWEPGNPDSRGDRFLAAAMHRRGLPGAGTRIFRRDSLTSIRIAARRGPQSGSPRIELSGHPDDLCSDGVLSLATQATLPYAYTAHVPPGLWSLSEDAQDYSFNDAHPYRTGHRYDAFINQAAWGPGTDLPYVGAGHRLYLGPQMFSDPVLPYGPSATVTYTLTKAGRTIVSRTVRNPNVPSPVLTSRGWYTLTATAVRAPNHRLPADALATRSSVRLRFYDDPASELQVRGYVARFRPLGLDAYNRAHRGTPTVVQIWPKRSKPIDARQQADSVRSVTAWYSVDDGRSWRALSVRNENGVRSVPVPASAVGYVSLRAMVTDTHGDTSTTTVIRAYSIG